MANYYTKKNMDKFNNALADNREKIADGAKLTVSISAANSKMGAVSSVSLLPYITCPFKCPECYAAKLAALRPAVCNAYARNTALAIEDISEYMRQVENAARGVRFFRWHVSGDILGGVYFLYMVDIAERLEHTDFLCFTKQYSVVNNYVAENGMPPKNLHVIFSAWDGVEMPNPYNFPVARVVRPGEDPSPEWFTCGGNCFDCACRGVGCWQLKPGETIAFNLH
jgi:hypothetical protein